MELAETLFVALSLAMDCFSVSVTNGLATKSNRILNGLKVGFSFGFFQTSMPLIGWLGGVMLADLISELDHWIGFLLLSIIGSKMILETLKEEAADSLILSFHVLLVLSVATSIDALVVGVSLAILGMPIMIAAPLFGLVTFFLSFIGMQLGHKLGAIFGRRVGIIGGLILIGVGIKILLGHIA